MLITLIVLATMIVAVVSAILAVNKVADNHVNRPQVIHKPEPKIKSSEYETHGWLQ